VEGKDQREDSKKLERGDGGDGGGGGGGMPRAYFCLSCLGRAPAVLQAITGTEADLLHRETRWILIMCQHLQYGRRQDDL